MRELWIAGVVSPLLFVLAGLILSKTFPKSPNNIYGFRTKRASTSQETWLYANRLFSKLLAVLNLFVLPLNVILIYVSRFVFDVNVVLMTYVVGFSAVLVTFITIFIVQHKVKIEFLEKE